jgi:hypothetical protein
MKILLFFWQDQLSIPRYIPTTIKKLHHSIIVPKVRENAISNDQASFCARRYSRSEQNENVRYIETWLWRFYNFNSTAGRCIALWSLMTNLLTGQTTSCHYIIARIDGRSTSLLNVYTSMNIEECRTVKGNETSVGSHLASKVDKHLLTWRLNVRYH